MSASELDGWQQQVQINQKIIDRLQLQTERINALQSIVLDLQERIQKLEKTNVARLLIKGYNA